MSYKHRIEAEDIAAELADLIYQDTDHQQAKDLDVIYPAIGGTAAIHIITPSGTFLATVTLIDPHHTIGPDYW